MNIIKALEKQMVLGLLENVYEDSQILSSQAVNPELSFYLGLIPCKSIYLSKKDALNAIAKSPDTIPFLPGHDKLVLSQTLAIWSQSINENQIYQTDPEDFIRLISPANPHHDVYYKIHNDMESLIISLGTKKKEIPIIHDSGWSWKFAKKSFRTGYDRDDLTRLFHDKMWTMQIVKGLRWILGIDPISLQ